MQSPIAGKISANFAINATLIAAALFSMSQGVVVVAAIALLGLLLIQVWAVVNTTNQNSPDRRSWVDAMSEASIDAMICADPALNIISVNRAAERILGFSPDELTGNNIAALWPHSEQIDQLKQAISDNFEAELPIDSRVRHETGYRRDGSTFPMEISVTPVKLEDEAFALINIRDRSEIESASHQAKRTLSFQKALMESSLSARLIIDQDGTVIEYNSAASQTLGFEADEIIGHAMSDKIVPEHYRKAHHEGLKRFLVTGKGPVLNQRTEITALKKSGEEFPIELTISPVLVDGRYYFSAEIRDISERRQHEEDMQEAMRQAELSSQAKSKFLATMSHEIRTPLNAVLGILSLLRSDESDPKKCELLNTAERSGKTLMETISDVLDYSKIEAGKLEIERQEFSLAGLLHEVTSLFLNSAHSKGVDLLTYFDPKLPTQIVGDRARTSQILKNFVSNAIKFTPSGCIEVSMHLIDHDQISLRVKDTGIGIPVDQHETMFEAFVQADNSDSRKFGGTGLGLSICKQLAELMDGTVEMTSKVGNGSTFECRLPFNVVDKQTLELEQKPTSVFIVNGSKEEQTTLRKQLLAFGLDVDKRVRELSNRDGDFPVLIDLRPQLESRIYPPYARVIMISDDIVQASSKHIALQRPVNIELLVKALDRAEKIDHLKSSTAASLNFDGSGKRVLVAEDSRANQMVIASILETMNFSVDVVSNGIEAFTAATSLPYDLVLMDVQMPEMDGLSATRQIRRFGGDAKKLPIIAVTAKAFREDVQECMSAGMTDYLSKPIQVDKLVSTLTKWVGETSSSDNVFVPEETTQIRDLADIVGAKKINLMLYKFLDEAKDKEVQISHAIERANTELVRTESHTLKSTARTFGFTDLGDLAEKLELEARDQNLLPDEKSVAKLSQHIREVELFVNAREIQS